MRAPILFMVHVWVAKANSRSVICNLEQMRIRR